jgi:hypothetical protein
VTRLASAQDSLQYFFPFAGAQLHAGWAHFDVAVMGFSSFVEHALFLRRMLACKAGFIKPGMTSLVRSKDYSRAYNSMALTEATNCAILLIRWRLRAPILGLRAQNFVSNSAQPAHSTNEYSLQ